MAFVEKTRWQLICDHLDDEFEIDELRIIASSIGIDLTNVRSKRDMCLLLAQDYLSYKSSTQERSCNNPDSLSGDEYNSLPDGLVVEYEEGGVKWCFTVDEIEKMMTNPFSGESIPLHVREEALRKKRDYVPSPRAIAHSLQVQITAESESSRRLKERLDTMTVPRDRLEEMDVETARKLVDYVAEYITSITQVQKNAILTTMGRSIPDGLLLLFDQVEGITYMDDVISGFFIKNDSEQASPVRQNAVATFFMFAKSIDDYARMREDVADSVTSAGLTEESSLKEYATTVANYLNSINYTDQAIHIPEDDWFDLQRLLVSNVATRWIEDADKRNDFIDGMMAGLDNEGPDWETIQFVYTARDSLREAIYDAPEDIWLHDVILQCVEREEDLAVTGFRDELKYDMEQWISDTADKWVESEEPENEICDYVKRQLDELDDPVVSDDSDEEELPTNRRLFDDEEEDDEDDDDDDDDDYVSDD